MSTQRLATHGDTSRWLHVLLVATAAAWLGWAAAGHGATYLALGDSTAAGVGASDPATTAYVPLFHNFLESHEGLGTDLTLKLLAEGGETSAILIHKWLPTALQEIHAGQVAIVTISIGGNDLWVSDILSVCSSEGLTRRCVHTIQDTLDAFATNFEYILTQLRAAGGAALPIIVMTYYNPLEYPECVPDFFLESLGNIVLEGDASLRLPQGLNDRIRSIAAAHHVAVADLVPGGVFPDRLSAAELADCFHPNDAGYAIIAHAFISAF